MASQRVMAILARVVTSAALLLNRDDVQRRVVVNAASLQVQIDSAHFVARMHNARVKDRERLSTTLSKKIADCSAND